MSDSPKTALGQGVEHLIGSARGGDQHALGQLLQAFRRLLMAEANARIPAELRGKAGPSDLVQDTLAEAVKDFPQFQGGSEPELRGWLCRILERNLANHARKYATQKRAAGREIARPEGGEGRPDPGEPVAPGPSPGSAAAQREEEEALAQAMSLLAEEDRSIILLRHREDRTFQNIGDRLGISAEAARKRFARAIERLRDLLEGAGHGGERAPVGPRAQEE